MSIHSRIKERRLALGMTSHQALAERLGVSWQTVQLWEKEGGTAPNRNRIDKVAQELGVTTAWLMNGQQVPDGGRDVAPDAVVRSQDGSTTYLQIKEHKLGSRAPKREAEVEYIFATHEEIHLLTLFRTADERERGELMDRLKALKKVVHSPTLVGGDKS